MEPGQWIAWALAGGAVMAALTLYPYLATAIAYRGSDNGLAYILLVMGVALWNAMFAAQLMDPHTLVKGFFLSLSLVGASLAGLGWFLFAGTASSTIAVPSRRVAYGLAAVVVGVNISLIITNPVHGLYWTLLADGPTSSVFVEIAPQPLYWLHTLQLVVLFGAGTALFFDAWRADIFPRYSRSYTVAGVATIVAIVGSNVLVPGGLSLAPLVATALTTVGWIQANRGHPLEKYRSIVVSAASRVR